MVLQPKVDKCDSGAIFHSLGLELNADNKDPAENVSLMKTDARGGTFEGNGSWNKCNTSTEECAKFPQWYLALFPTLRAVL